MMPMAAGKAASLKQLLEGKNCYQSFSFLLDRTSFTCAANHGNYVEVASFVWEKE